MGDDACARMPAYASTCICMHMRAYACIRCMHNMRACVRACMHVCACMCMHVRACACTVCMHATHAYACMCMHMHATACTCGLCSVLSLHMRLINERANNEQPVTFSELSGNFQGNGGIHKIRSKMRSRATK